MPFGTDMGGFPGQGMVPRVGFAGTVEGYPGIVVQRAQLTPPMWQDFGIATINTGVTYAQRKDRLYATATSSSTLRASLVVMPATPYTVELAGLVTSVLQTSSHAIWGGIGLYDGTKFETYVFGSNQSGQLNIAVQQWTNSTTFGSQALLGTIAMGSSSPLVFLRIVDDGINRNFYISPNGKDWTTFLSRSRSAQLTAGGTHIGLQFYNFTPNSTLGLYSLYHWRMVPGALGDDY